MNLKRVALIVVAVLFLTGIPYAVAYVTVVNHSDFFLTEGSISSYTLTNTANVVSTIATDQLPMSTNAIAIVTHYSWLNGIHERFVFTEFLLFASIFLVGYFMKQKAESQVEFRQGLVFTRDGTTATPSFYKKAFLGYGFFVALWLSSMQIMLPHKLDEVIIIVVFVVGFFLLASTAISKVSQFTRQKNKPAHLKESLANFSYLFGVFVALWIVSISVIPFEATIPFVALGITALLALVTVLSLQRQKTEV